MRGELLELGVRAADVTELRGPELGQVGLQVGSVAVSVNQTRWMVRCT